MTSPAPKDLPSLCLLLCDVADRVHVELSVDESHDLSTMAGIVRRAAQAQLQSVATTRGLFDKGAATTSLIPIAAAKELSEAHQLPQVIIVAWDGSREHVVTYGSTLGDSDNAAQGGNLVKDALKWPPTRYSTSERVHSLVERANALLDRLAQIEREPRAGHNSWREVASLRDFLVGEGLRS